MELIKIIAVLVVCVFIVYGSMLLSNVSSSFSVKEPFEAGTITSYSAQIKAQTVKLQDELLIDKYRSDYETAIINLDDFVGFLMLKETLNVPMNSDKPDDTMQALRRINELKMCKDSLNTTMSFLDKAWWWWWEEKKTKKDEQIIILSN